MEDVNVNPVDAGSEVVVTPQITEPVVSNNEPVNAGNGEVTTPVVETKPVQTPEQNALYANIRREAESKAQDKLIDEMYGQSHNIHTKAEYDKAVQAEQTERQRQEYEQAGINPDLINKLISDNPTVKQANEIIARQQQDAKINSEVQALFQEYPEARNEKIPDSVFLESIEKGIPLSYAYAKYATSQLKNKVSEFEKGVKTSEVNSKNAVASTGSTTGNGANTGEFISKETFEANKKNSEWMSQNYDLLKSSMNKWN
jgi:hypothetical protein